MKHKKIALPLALLSLGACSFSEPAAKDPLPETFEEYAKELALVEEIKETDSLDRPDTPEGHASLDHGDAQVFFAKKDLEILKQPDEKGSVLRTLEQGAPLLLGSNQNGWYPLLPVGWVRAEDVTDKPLPPRYSKNQWQGEPRESSEVPKETKENDADPAYTGGWIKLDDTTPF